MQCPVKFDLFQVTYSDVGFRNHRDCYYRLKVKFPDGKTYYCYAQTYSQLLYFFNIIKSRFK